MGEGRGTALGAWAWETRRSDAGELGGCGDELGGEGELGGGGSKLGSEGMAAAASELVGGGRARRRRTRKGGRGHNGVRARGLRVSSEAATSNSEARAWAQQRPSSWAAARRECVAALRGVGCDDGRARRRQASSEVTTTSMARAARTRRGALGNGRRRDGFGGSWRGGWLSLVRFGRAWAWGSAAQFFFRA